MTPGIQTTEFWLTLLTQIQAFIAIVHPGFQFNDGLVKAVTSALAGVATLWYTMHRTSLKETVVNNSQAVIPATPQDTLSAG